MSDEAGGIGMWAIVELFGHTQLAGYATEEQIAGSPMLKVEIPAGPDAQGENGADPFVRYVGAKAIYGITPCSEDDVRRFVEYYPPKRLPVYLPQLLPSPDALPAAVVDGDWEEEDGAAPF